MRKTELDKYIETIRVVNPSFKLRTGKRIIFADIQEDGRTEDGVNNYKVELMDGTVIQVFKRISQNFLAYNGGYLIELLNGERKRINRSQVIEIL